MWVAQDQENGRLFGPFTNEDKGEQWALAYITKVHDSKAWSAYVDAHTSGPHEADMAFTGSIGDFLTNRLWLIQEVEYVDEDNLTFAPVIEEVSDTPKEPEHLVISGHYSDVVVPQDDPKICAECGGPNDAEPNAWEVINDETGQVGVVHESCYLANDDVLTLR